MNSEFIKGIIPPIVTPVTVDEQIDEQALRNQIDFMIDGGIDGILAFGSNGEFYMFGQEEMRFVLSVLIDQVRGRIPVYMGIGAIRTSTCINLAKMGLDLGVDGISVLQPMFLKPTEDELETHLSSIAESISGTPMLLYNNPGRTGYGMSQDMVWRLAHTYENIVGMKDSSGDMTQTIEFIRRNRDVGFRVMSGKDTLIYSGMCAGAVGAVCSTANFLPDLVCSIYRKFIAGDCQGSLEAQWRLNPIRLQMDKSSFPVATKDYANLLGHEVGRPVLPSKCSPEPIMAQLGKCLKDNGFLLAEHGTSS
ncbi:dihydrodipicolinate synthase family protein [Sediminispirochaeta smaragdinae]|uniref:Dihydrodipicolinate synthetase n=1 Tax=Sediminispirochaeta smaragdinae (strain DSM 11293 / JCM 15392 / SEBR 4228) TaxID=573413 RepID=E1RBC6_SEDSS|nr:dihydrodipicolinate synthase family protein [Sediminispirochaeta smaragdinae]ADK79656.1 dihydrodipicolinate synthetase [Sediminispirochaeta smaragdinae DSM 11293]